jgi:hypothetical protein
VHRANKREVELGITRGTPVWGADAALKRFSALYEGTWRLEPDTSGFKIIMIGDAAAQIYIPIIFTIGAPGQQARQRDFYSIRCWSKRRAAGRSRASCPYLRLRNSVWLWTLLPTGGRRHGRPPVRRRAE